MKYCNADCDPAKPGDFVQRWVDPKNWDPGVLNIIAYQDPCMDADISKESDPLENHIRDKTEIIML